MPIDTFTARRDELKARFADPADEFYLDDPALIDDELEDRDYYTSVNVFWVPEAARWEALRAAAKQSTIGKQIDDALAVIEAENSKLKGILGINHQPLVSVDFNHDARSSIYDATQTRVMGGTLVKVLSWYDNEWGFSNRMLDMALTLVHAK